VLAVDVAAEELFDVVAVEEVEGVEEAETLEALELAEVVGLVLCDALGCGGPAK